MKDDMFDTAFEEFVTQRINDLGFNCPDVVSDSITQVGYCMEQLKAAVPAERTELFDELEDAMTLQVGEETRYYYRSGFADATRYILKVLDVELTEENMKGVCKHGQRCEDNDN